MNDVRMICMCMCMNMCCIWGYARTKGGMYPQIYTPIYGGMHEQKEACIPKYIPTYMGVCTNESAPVHTHTNVHMFIQHVYMGVCTNENRPTYMAIQNNEHQKRKINTETPCVYEHVDTYTCIHARTSTSH